MQLLQGDYVFHSVLQLCVAALLIVERMDLTTFFFPTVVNCVVCSSGIKQGITFQWYFRKLSRI